jgi:hypothetical protein
VSWWSGRVAQSGSALTSAGATSLTGFAVNAAVSRRVSSEDFGRFSVMYLVLYFGMASLRSVFGEPLLLTTQVSDTDAGAINRWAVGSAVAAAAVLGLLEAVVLVSIFHSLWLIVVAAALPLLVLQDVLRYVAFALGRPQIAAASDVVVLLPLPVLLIWHPADIRIEVLAVLLWGASCVVSAGLASRFVLTGLPAIQLRRYWDVSRNAAVGSLSEFAATALVLVIPVTLIPLGGTLVDTATVRVLQMVFSPITVVHAAAFTLLAPRVTRRTQHSGRGLDGLLGYYAVILGGCSVALTAVLAATPSLGGWLFPSSYSEARSKLYIYLIVQLMGVAVGTVTLGLRATNAYGGLIQVRIISAVATPVVAVWAVRQDGVRGFCLAVAAMQLPVLIVGLRMLLKFRPAIRGHDE